jgi:hypothetical protein
MVTNLAYFFERTKKVRGDGRWIWVKDSNGEDRRNVLLGGDILNPNKGLGYLWAGQLMEYKPGVGMLIFRSFLVTNNVSNDTTVYVNGDGYSDVPEVGQVLMKAPDAIYVTTSTANTSTGAITSTTAEYTGQSAKVTDVQFDSVNNRFVVTLDQALTLSANDILVEAEGKSKSATAKVLVKNPNVFNEANREMLPTDGSFGFNNAKYAASGVYDKQIWIQRTQPLPKYVLAKNKSLIEGIFWI